MVNPAGPSPFLLIGDHAGNAIPDALGTLGLSEVERSRHIGWDIGIAALGTGLSAALDAVFVHQHYSRLVVDCNRAPGAPDAMPPVSDGTVVPGNAALSDEDTAARFGAIHAPYQAAIGAEIARRDAVAQPTVLIALHSFTPRMTGQGMAGQSRPWQIGVLHDGGNAAFALALLERLRGLGRYTVGDNEPYRMDLIDYTVPRHAFAAGRPYAELEVRQDLLGDAAGVAGWCEVLAAILPETWDALAG